MTRCPWADGDPGYAAYHDGEWGRPQVGDRALFEKLCLEGFQAGLSWLTILRKRPAFRRAFAGFDVAAVAAFDEHDEDRLMADAAIVRNRAKIAATVGNARAALALGPPSGDDPGPLAGLVWAHAPPAGPAPRTLADVPAATPASLALSRTLKGAGFRFVGPTTTYAFMQAMGLVNDHLAGCLTRRACAEQRPRALARLRAAGVL